jgi:hypothetical protein
VLARRLHQFVRLVLGLAAVLGQQPGPAFGQLVHPGNVLAVLVQVVQDAGVEALQPDQALGAQEGGHVVGGRRGVGVADHQQGVVRRVGQQAHRGLEHEHARRLGADQRPGQVEALARQQVAEVVAGDPARDVRVPVADQRLVPCGQVAQRPVDLRPAAAAVDGPLVVVIAGGAHGHPGAVVGDDVQREDVVHGLAAQHRMGAARVVADHPAERAPVVGGRVHRERQPVPRRGVPELVADHARLHARRPRLRIQARDLVHVLGEVEHHGRVHALPGQPRTAAAGQHRHLVRAAYLQRAEHVVGVPRDDYPDRHLPVDRGVVGVRGLGARIEPDLPLHRPAQVPGQAAPVSHPDRSVPAAC